ncbi:unnamed protein product [marine sediment metagenome]|uniref:Peptidoglycan binding-like domain-containing protein n=1 Tax=marine sediment metagenome TaxID=412755 RepID=X1PB61_9ZZZZ
MKENSFTGLLLKAANKPIIKNPTKNKETEEEEKAELMKELLARIEFLEEEIARIRAEIETILASRQNSVSCGKFEVDLYYGMKTNSQVRCLQEFLKTQGTEIYPEGLITGNFLELTRQAIKRYQEKHADKILKPLDLSEGTGYFGPLTRATANQELGY